MKKILTVSETNAVLANIYKKAKADGVRCDCLGPGSIYPGHSPECSWVKRMTSKKEYHRAKKEVLSGQNHGQ